MSSQPPVAPEITRTLTRVVLPLGILLAAIAGLAWIAQFRGSQGGKDENVVVPPPPAGTPTIVFKRYDEHADKRSFGAIWDPKQLTEAESKKSKSSWVPEFEPMAKNYYDFEFSNPTQSAAELGVLRVSCDCSNVQACLVPYDKWDAYQKSRAVALKQVQASPPTDDFTWVPLDKNSPGLVVPPGERGVVRMVWGGRDSDSGPVALSFTAWTRPKGAPVTEYTEHLLFARIAYVKPAYFDAMEVNVATLRPGESSSPETLYCWSATRDLKLEKIEPFDPCVEMEIQKLSASELEEYRQKLSEKTMETRLRSAYRIIVKAHESNGGKQLDLGALQRPLALRVIGDGEPLDLELPKLRGVVLGEVTLQGDPSLRVALGSLTRDQVSKKKFALEAKPGIELELENPAFEPAWLGIQLELVKLARTGEEGNVPWELRMSVRPTAAGPIAEQAALLLRIKGTNRKLRLPLTGSVSR